MHFHGAFSFNSFFAGGGGEGKSHSLVVPKMSQAPSPAFPVKGFQVEGDVEDRSLMKPWRVNADLGGPIMEMVSPQDWAASTVAPPLGCPPWQELLPTDGGIHAPPVAPASEGQRAPLAPCFAQRAPRQKGSNPPQDQTHHPSARWQQEGGTLPQPREQLPSQPSPARGGLLLVRNVNLTLPQGGA